MGVFAIFDWSNLLNLTIVNGQLDHQESESAKKLKLDNFFYFFLIFKVFTAKKSELPTLKNNLQKLFLFRPKNGRFLFLKRFFLSNWTCWFRIRKYFCNRNIYSIFFRLLKSSDDKIMVKYCKLNFHAISIFVQCIFLNNMVFFNYFLSEFLSFINSWASATRFCSSKKLWKSLKNRKNAPISKIFSDSESWRSN